MNKSGNGNMIDEDYFAAQFFSLNRGIINFDKLQLPEIRAQNRVRDSYYAMKAKQEPVSRFDISWSTWTNILFTVCFLDFVTVFNLAYCLC